MDAVNPVIPFERFRFRLHQESLVAHALKAVVKNPTKATKALRAVLEDATARYGAAAVADAFALVAKGLSSSKAWHDDLIAPDAFAAAGGSTLSFGNCTRVNPPYVLAAATAASAHLRGLDVSGCFHFGDEHVKGVLTGAPRLAYLNLSNCRKITDAALGHVTAHGAALRHIDLGGCFNITPDGLVSFLAHHPHLPAFTGLGLSGLPGLSDPRTLATVRERCVRLQRLSVGYTAGGDDGPLRDAIACNPRLVYLQVHWGEEEGVTDGVVAAAMHSCPGLYLLDVTGCKGVSADALLLLASTRAVTVTFASAYNRWAPPPAAIPPTAAAAGGSAASSSASLSSSSSSSSVSATVASASGGRYPGLHHHEATRRHACALVPGTHDSEVASVHAGKCFALEAEDWSEVFTADAAAAADADAAGSAAAGSGTGGGDDGDVAMGRTGSSSSSSSSSGGAASRAASASPDRCLRVVCAKHSGAAGRALVEALNRAGIAMSVQA